MSQKTTKKKVRKSPRHIFRFEIESVEEGSKPKIITHPARVKKATREVTLTLTAKDVERSIRLHGAGNTAKCSMAVCAHRQKDQFPHDVHGFIDWQYHRAYVVTKLDREGFPAECVCYQHCDEIARLNDTPGGQQKLLERLREKGDRTIKLTPPRKTQNRTREPKTAHPGRNSPQPASLPAETMKRHVGARLRYATLKVGAVSLD